MSPESSESSQQWPSAENFTALPCRLFAVAAGSEVPIPLRTKLSLSRATYCRKEKLHLLFSLQLFTCSLQREGDLEVMIG